MERDELLSLMQAASYKPLTAEELMAALGQEDREAFQEFLDRLEQEGYIVRTRKGKYGLPEKMGLVCGYLQASPKGFAFVVPRNKGQGDLYISFAHLNGAMHEDLVLARMLPGGAGPRREGEVIRILQRKNFKIVGTFTNGRRVNFVVPDDVRLHQDVIVPPGCSLGAQEGDKVVVEITRWPEARRLPEGKVVEVLGRSGDPGIDVLCVIKKYELDLDFPPEVLEEAEKLPGTLGEREWAGRRDLRSWPLVTIDGPDAKDLDDAVSIEKLPGGDFLLGVHIADVSYYVREGSFLDREAFRRGTSVYFVDRVIPMLPPRLSQDLCSLNAGEDRLAISVLMVFSPEGVLKDYEIFPSVIQVKKRMTYDEVQEILDQESPWELPGLPDFHLMAELASILKARRERRGAIDFDFPEAVVELDEKGEPVAIIPHRRTLSESIIEEFMIAANETVAQHLLHLGLPGVYRVHEEPAADKMEELNNFLAHFGFHIKPNRQGRYTPHAFQRVLRSVQGRPEERVISTVMLRSMMHARYANRCLGHFGLASSHYCHFTAPIRRYPDLVVHRILREWWEKGSLEDQRMEYLETFTAIAAQRASERERIAEEAEREALDMKKVQFMERHVGEVFKGVINGVAPFGFFVELENTVEGLVHVSTLTDDYYHYQEDLKTLVGEHTGRVFRLGQEVEVLVAKVNVEARQIDFELLPKAEEAKTRKSPRARHKKVSRATSV